MTTDQITAEQWAMWAIAGNGMLPMNQLPVTLHEMHRRVAEAIRKHAATLATENLALKAENELLRKACRDAGIALWKFGNGKSAAEERFAVACRELGIDPDGRCQRDA